MPFYTTTNFPSHHSFENYSYIEKRIRLKSQLQVLASNQTINLQVSAYLGSQPQRSTSTRKPYVTDSETDNQEQSSLSKPLAFRKATNMFIRSMGSIE